MFDWIKELVNDVAANSKWFDGWQGKFQFSPISLDWNKNSSYPKYFVIYPNDCENDNKNGNGGTNNQNRSSSSLDPYRALYGLTQQKLELAKYGTYFTENECNKKAQFLIFSGKPGMGKTELAKRTANLFGVPLVIAEPGNILGENISETCKNIQLLGTECKRMKSCIVLFDEIDYFIGNESHAAIRSQFRQLIDGPRNIFENCNILFIGTTNQLINIEKDILTRAEVLPEFIKPNSEQIIKWFVNTNHIPKYINENDRINCAYTANHRKFDILSSRDYERCFHISNTWVSYQMQSRINNQINSHNNTKCEIWKTRFDACLQDKKNLYKNHHT